MPSDFSREDSSWKYMTQLQRAKYEETVENRSLHFKRPPQNWNELIGGDDAPVATLSKRKGVFSAFPGSTPKYDTSIEGAPSSMARLLIPFPSHAQRESFMSSLASKGPDAKKLGGMLATDSMTTQNGSSSPGEGLGYIDFLLQSAQETRQEKVQIVDVLSDNYVAYFFGASPPIFSYQGTLLNTYQDDWRSAFSIIYDEIIRGTKLARRRRLLTLTYDNVAVTGTAVAMSQTLTADMEMAANFTLDILVKRYDIYRLVDTTPTTPGEFPSRVVDLGTFGGLRLGRVKRTFRTIGEPQFATSKPTKAAGEETTAGSTDYGSFSTASEDQASQDVDGYIPEDDLNPDGANDDTVIEDDPGAGSF